MANLAVRYQRPDKSTARLFAEVRLAFGDPRAENKGFVAGSGPTTWNESSHNADAFGVAHAVDIGVDIEGDGTGIPVEAAEPLANFLRGFIGSRIAYVIYNRRIDSGNGWQPYTGESPHQDHIHVSTTWDYFWGDYAPAMAWNPDDGAVWGVGGSITPGGGSVRPIPKEDDMTEYNDWSAASKQAFLKDMYKALWFGVPGAPLIQNRRLGRGEWPETLLGSSEQRTQRELLPPALAGVKATVDPKVLAASIPKEMAAQVAAELGKRITNG